MNEFKRFEDRLYELTYLWHRVNPNLTVRSVPAAEVYNMFMEFGVKSINQLIYIDFVVGGVAKHCFQCNIQMSKFYCLI